jgi:hypothetical protein
MEPTAAVAFSTNHCLAYNTKNKLSTSFGISPGIDFGYCSVKVASGPFAGGINAAFDAGTFAAAAMQRTTTTMLRKQVSDNRTTYFTHALVYARTSK